MKSANATSVLCHPPGINSKKADLSRVSLPCNCTDKNTTGLIVSDTERLGQKIIQESFCIPWKAGVQQVWPTTTATGSPPLILKGAVLVRLTTLSYYIKTKLF